MNLKATGYYMNLIDFNEHNPGKLIVGEDFLALRYFREVELCNKLNTRVFTESAPVSGEL
jgi:hypothetical protein